MGQYFVNQQGSTFCHTTCPAAGTKAATFAAKGDQVLRMAFVTLHPQKTMLKTGTRLRFRSLGFRIHRVRRVAFAR